jgi:hypothetical protein
LGLITFFKVHEPFSIEDEVVVNVPNGFYKGVISKSPLSRCDIVELQLILTNDEEATRKSKYLNKHDKNKEFDIRKYFRDVVDYRSSAINKTHEVTSFCVC